jgi:hypothetical protein
LRRYTTDKYIALASVLEGVVILKKNPLFVDDGEEEKK